MFQQLHVGQAHKRSGHGSVPETTIRDDDVRSSYVHKYTYTVSLCAIKTKANLLYKIYYVIVKGVLTTTGRLGT